VWSVLDWLALLVGVVLFVVGLSLLAMPTAPSWLTAALKGPARGNLTSSVNRMQALGLVLIGIGCGGSSRLHLIEPHSAAALEATGLVVLLLVGGVIAYVLGAWLSRRSHA